MVLPSKVKHLKNHLDKEVSNCFEAAIYRNISLKKELKTLLLTNNKNEYYVFNTLGNCRLINLDSDLRWLSKKQLINFGLESGTINPYNVKEKIPNIKFIGFCHNIFEERVVYTNDGTLTGTIVIPTKYIIKEFKDAYYFKFSTETNIY